eukprot:CAMPEP_0182562900 /NCGR_PEP_ID=MMETSP1324-20130603/5162_1 /TAXON_ID=236786 /ORGANISM="Florenciella sp., Strain RCC1587" /LENGTH=156 /DNA_ID=CAMNT_0024775973 /DNA_START=47 /DNA_END=517 /DNA_ORIENTATION=-
MLYVTGLLLGSHHALLRQQVVQLLIIDLEVAHGHLRRQNRGVFKGVEEGVDSTADHAGAGGVSVVRCVKRAPNRGPLHRVSFTRTRRAVREAGALVALHHPLDQRRNGLEVHLALRRLLVVHTRELEVVRLAGHVDLVAPRITPHHRLYTFRHLVR